MVRQRMSVQKLFFIMENLSWSWQGTVTVCHLVKSVSGVTEFHSFMDRIAMGGMGCVIATCAVQMMVLKDPRHNQLLFLLEWKMVFWEMP